MEAAYRGSALGYAGDAEPRVKFTGQVRDVETGLDYFGARYMSAAQGRFTSPDAPFADQHASDPQSWNLYSYVRNNPLGNVDPTGRDCLGAVAGRQSFSSCGDFLIGGAMAVGNAATNIVNAPNAIANAVSRSITGEDLVAEIPSFTPSNAEQQNGMESMNFVMLVAPAVKGAAGAVGTIAAVAEEAAATGGRLGSAATRAQNSAIADSLESRGFKITGGGGRLPEEHLAGPGGGTRGGTFVDVTAVRNGRTVRVQTTDTRADGVTPTSREAAAAARIRAQQNPRDHIV